jgi:hypothetical protein
MSIDRALVESEIQGRPPAEAAAIRMQELVKTEPQWTNDPGTGGEVADASQAARLWPMLATSSTWFAENTFASSQTRILPPGASA